ncbi:hypothetical protein R5D33_001215 [Salmonella enterica]|uniref:Uncharacterized protein n=1 Tax=Salmonella enterica subsp. VII serovar 40:z4,z24:[z39] TaxID=1967625 RepID=A0A731TBZ5_SALEE|nr:hypothetical protein [Salmonella enterica]EDO5296829.1 hypothetical protein [Salmonella enterica subsp. houtenae serovar 40:z4,z24:-]EDS6440140.1 hypothetical protein [Salmonella enterica subsp. VII str. CFSAN000550]EDU7900615.1 hypothetical protein [Salmonella enterica subsp. houtenae]QJY65316.1 hypothetical protein HPG81_01385 [Salmonella enterica subsp. VII serovar 1,40:g,z51:--]QUZ25049.1 hypothetical protein JYN32_08260 [Salmonella enterica subsp. VII str. CFSAN000554]HAE4732743.1 hyp
MGKGNSARPEKAKGLKRLKLAQIDIYPAISGAVPTYTGDDRLMQLWYSDEPVSGADCPAAIARNYLL